MEINIILLSPKKAGVYLGRTKVSGAASHVAFDEAEDHSGMMSNMLSTVIRDDSDLEKAVVHIRAFIPMVGEYFQALRAETL